MKVGPRLSVAMVVATSPHIEFGVTMAPFARPEMAKPPPSQPAAEAAWAGTFSVSVASENAARPREMRRVRAFKSIKSTILSGTPMVRQLRLDGQRAKGGKVTGPWSEEHNVATLAPEPAA